MNILSLLIGRDGCSGYRVKNHLTEIAKSHKEHDVKFIEGGDSGENILKLITGANVVLMREQHDSFLSFLKSQNEIDISKKLFVVDMDDDVFDISPFNEAYRTAGVSEVKYQDKWLWRNGENGFDAERNKKAADIRVDFLKNADLITVTTPTLQKRIQSISQNPNVEVCPNAINFNHWNKWPLSKGKEIRIGWTGGSSHYEDWFSIKDGLLEVFKKHPECKLVIQGSNFPGLIKDIPHELHDWIDWEGHPYKAASLNLDIAIIPLTNSSFNSHKSCIKWYEFSSLGVPCLVSNVAPYSLEIENGKTAVCYNNSKEFVAGLEKLITDKKLRTTIGNNAYKWVFKHRNLKDVAKDYLAIYEKYLNKKYEHTRNN